MTWLNVDDLDPTRALASPLGRCAVWARKFGFKRLAAWLFEIAWNRTYPGCRIIQVDQFDVTPRRPGVKKRAEWTIRDGETGERVCGKDDAAVRALRGDDP